jgi:hypothetical protein
MSRIQSVLVLLNHCVLNRDGQSACRIIEKLAHTRELDTYEMWPRNDKLVLATTPGILK